MRSFFQSKTTWGAITGIIGAVSMGVTHQMPWAAVFQTVIGSALAAFLRDAQKSGINAITQALLTADPADRPVTEGGEGSDA